jgi:adenosylmethionine-8-amino-7-oxononanoate aminotransferase
VGVELVADRATKMIFPDSRAVGSEVSTRALRKGVKVFGLKGHGSGMISDFLVVTPPLTIERREIDTIVDVVDSAIGEVEKDL